MAPTSNGKAKPLLCSHGFVFDCSCLADSPGTIRSTSDVRHPACGRRACGRHTGVRLNRFLVAQLSCAPPCLERQTPRAPVRVPHGATTSFEYQVLKTCGGPVVDIWSYHMGHWNALGLPWEQNVELFRTIMRDPDHINYVSVFREPKEHLVSLYYYMLEHKTEVST